MIRRLLPLFLLWPALVTAQVQNPSTIELRDEGTTQGRVTILNCTGAGITCSASGFVGTANVTGGGGGGGNFLELSVTFRPDSVNKAVSDWRRAASDQVATPTDVVWLADQNRFILVADDVPAGSTVTTAISTDGATWFNNNGITAGSAVHGVAYDPAATRLCAVFVDTSSQSLNGGLTWTNFAAQTGAWEKIAWSPSLSLFAAVTTNAVMTSPDCQTWTSRTAATGAWVDVIWSVEQAKFVAVGTDAVMTSPDGVAWTGQTPAGAGNSWLGVAWSPNLSLFAAVSGAGTDEVMTSPTGVTWTARQADSSMGAVTWSTELQAFVGCGNATPTAILSSSSGTSWTSHPAIVTGLGCARIAWAPLLRRLLVVGPDSASPAAGNGRQLSASSATDGFHYLATVTGQAWVTSTSQILCAPFATSADGQTVETYAGAGLSLEASNRVAGTGFDVYIRNPYGAYGTYRFHCTGS